MGLGYFIDFSQNFGEMTESFFSRKDNNSCRIDKMISWDQNQQTSQMKNEKYKVKKGAKTHCYTQKTSDSG